MKILDALLARRRDAQRDTPVASAPALRDRITATIDDALASAGLTRDTVDGAAIAGVIDGALVRAGLRGPGDLPGPAVTQAPLRAAEAAGRSATARDPAGSFLARTYAGPEGTLAYMLHVPAGYDTDATRRFPLLVMLHGCTQSPQDFAAGTRMNALADVHGLLVAYPAQSANANGSRCWNWFRPKDQARGAGEPALIAGMAAEVTSAYRVDPARTYVAGLSAGAAMAVVLGRTYPDVFAAVGVHSGLPYGAADDVASAFSAMKSGASRGDRAAPRHAEKAVPTIVFHGDRDHTVTAANGAAVVAQVTGAAPAGLTTQQDSGTASGGRSYTRTRHADASGRTLVEEWQVHGGGHAWMGGSAKGTYTDPQGPDASAEMVRFFLQHSL
ncbi:extracellular catalytic domain type 1 short-chain-length polyhydroxyalkanoate depolymerase [Luteimonas vadosa]|uniref:extracellular catalytic domain type 1 short-chain-length polyhydroxyalkanoate depolymerase n=1 Tax=Luteimonas vadosa TaxID=1165507 RepID=UPI0031E6B89C